MRANMSSLASHLWSGGLSGWVGGQNCMLWNETRTLQRTAIVLAPILRYWRKVYCLIILLEGFFLKDNARIHIAKITEPWLESHGIQVAEHPPHSPDLNPIEHIWKAMKSILRRDHRYLKGLKDNAESRVIFIRALKAVWWAVPLGLIDGLIHSMPRCYHAV